MTKIIIALLLISSGLSAQTKVLQVKDYIFLYPNTYETRPTCIANDCFTEIIGADTLARIYSDGTIMWKAALVAGSVSDTLSASGITGICRITIPATVNTQRIIQYGEIAIIFSYVNYSISFSNEKQLPITITRISDGQKIVIIYGGGVFDWIIQPKYAWLGRVGTTRLKRITLP